MRGAEHYYNLITILNLEKNSYSTVRWLLLGPYQQYYHPTHPRRIGSTLQCHCVHSRTLQHGFHISSVLHMFVTLKSRVHIHSGFQIEIFSSYKTAITTCFLEVPPLPGSGGRGQGLDDSFVGWAVHPLGYCEEQVRHVITHSTETSL